jgi:hypothetical protein
MDWELDNYIFDRDHLNYFYLKCLKFEFFNKIVTKFDIQFDDLYQVMIEFRKNEKKIQGGSFTLNDAQLKGGSLYRDTLNAFDQYLNNGVFPDRRSKKAIYYKRFNFFRRLAYAVLLIAAIAYGFWLFNTSKSLPAEYIKASNWDSFYELQWAQEPDDNILLQKAINIHEQNKYPFAKPTLEDIQIARRGLSLQPPSDLERLFNWRLCSDFLQALFLNSISKILYLVQIIEVVLRTFFRGTDDTFASSLYRRLTGRQMDQNLLASPPAVVPALLTIAPPPPLAIPPGAGDGLRRRRGSRSPARNRNLGGGGTDKNKLIISKIFKKVYSYEYENDLPLQLKGGGIVNYFKRLYAKGKCEILAFVQAIMTICIVFYMLYHLAAYNGIPVTFQQISEDLSLFFQNIFKGVYVGVSETPQNSISDILRTRGWFAFLKNMFALSEGISNIIQPEAGGSMFGLSKDFKFAPAAIFTFVLAAIYKMIDPTTAFFSSSIANFLELKNWFRDVCEDIKQPKLLEINENVVNSVSAIITNPKLKREFNKNGLNKLRSKSRVRRSRSRSKSPLKRVDNKSTEVLRLREPKKAINLPQPIEPPPKAQVVAVPLPRNSPLLESRFNKLSSTIPTTTPPPGFQGIFPPRPPPRPQQKVV